jgi:outer membrane protein assembly factor BamB
MVDFRSASGCRPRLAVALVAVTVAIAASPTQARQVLLVADEGNNVVGEYSPVTGAAINASFITGAILPGRMALDDTNHLFLMSSSGGGSEPPVIAGKYNATTGAAINARLITVSAFALNFAVDGNNHVFVADRAATSLLEFDATTGAAINQNLFPPTGAGLAADRSNHLFLTSSNGVAEYDATTGAVINSTFVTGLSQPGFIGLDAGNHMFVTYGSGNNLVGKYDATTGTAINSLLVSAPASVSHLAFDEDNHIFTASYGTTVSEYDATTGALINPAFISGFNNISGLAFMAPVPEPSSLLLIAAAAIGGIYFRRRFTAGLFVPA